jgi:alkylhydroperoxidase family enzyme
LTALDLARRSRGAFAETGGDARIAVKLTEEPDKIVDKRPGSLARCRLSDRDIWDIASTAAFFNMSNRAAAAVGMRPNAEYHAMAR